MHITIIDVLGQVEKTVKKATSLVMNVMPLCINQLM